MGRRRVLGVALVGLIGCAHETRFLGEKLPAACASDAGAERCAGWFTDRVMMAAAERTYDDPEAAAYVGAVGARVLRATSATASEPITFRLLDDPSPQAYANVGRIIYVDRGALAVLRDEAELAALLAHEIAHVVAAHQHESFTEVAGDERSGDGEDRHLRDQRDDETQADELAVRFVAAAGYDPGGVERMLRALAASVPDPEDLARSQHPRWLDRIAHVQAYAAHFASVRGVRDEAGYRRHLAHLVVGPDPTRAFILTAGPSPAPHAIPPQAAVFARAGLAVDLGVAHGDEATIDGGAITLYFAGDHATVELRLVSATFAKFYASGDGEAVAQHAAAGGRTLVIYGRGAAAAGHVRALAAATRRIRPTERAQLHPIYADFGPRALWTPTAPLAED